MERGGTAPLRRKTRDATLAIMLIGMACLAQPVLAASTQSSHARGATHVLMMVGGIAADENEIPDTANAQTTENTAEQDVSTEDAGKSSIVVLPGRPLLEGPAFPATVASRVLALAPLVREAARAAQIDSALLMAVIDVESGGNPQAVSPKGATGLMQLMPETGARNGASNLFDPRQNVAAGARYLSRLMSQFGNVQLALAAYNAGEGAVQKYGGQIPPYAETIDYVPRVLQRYWHYRNIDAVAVGKLRSESRSGRFLLVREDAGGID